MWCYDSTTIHRFPIQPAGPSLQKLHLTWNHSFSVNNCGQLCQPCSQTLSCSLLPRFPSLHHSLIIFLFLCVRLSVAMAMIHPQVIHPQVMTIQPGVVTSSAVTSGVVTAAFEPGRERWSSGLFSCFDDMGICGYLFLLLLTAVTWSDQIRLSEYTCIKTLKYSPAVL